MDTNELLSFCGSLDWRDIRHLPPDSSRRVSPRHEFTADYPSALSRSLPDRGHPEAAPTGVTAVWPSRPPERGTHRSARRRRQGPFADATDFVGGKAMSAVPAASVEEVLHNADAAFGLRAITP